MPLTEVNVQLNTKWVIMRGVFSILFGLAALSWPATTLVVITLLFGVYALADGLFAIGAGIQQERRHEPFGFTLFEGIIGVGVGVVTLFWPKITLLAISILVGVWAISTGSLELLTAFELPRISVYPKSKVSRWLLGVMGVLSIAMGLAIFVWPILGTITLLTLIAGYAICFGALMVGLGLHLRKIEKEATRASEKHPRAA